MEFEKEIEKDRNSEEFQRPMAAFVTFEYPQAVNLVVEMFGDS